MDAWGQPPRRSGALPLVLIATGLFGILAAFGLGIFLGYQVGLTKAVVGRAASKESDEISKKRINSQFTSTPVAASGWFNCRFEDMRISVTLPGEPEIGELTTNEADVYRYSNVKSFAFYEVYGEKSDVYLVRYFYYRDNPEGSKEVLSESLQEYRESPEYQNATISPIRERTVSGIEVFEGTATYDWHGGRYKTLTFVSQEDRASLQLIVTAEPKDAAETYARVLSTLKFAAK